MTEKTTITEQEAYSTEIIEKDGRNYTTIPIIHAAAIELAKSSDTPEEAEFFAQIYFKALAQDFDFSISPFRTNAEIIDELIEMFPGAFAVPF